MSDEMSQKQGGKACTKCGEHKPYDGFYKLRAARDGRQSWCKACTIAHNTAKARAKRIARREQLGEDYVPLAAERKQEAMLREIAKIDPYVDEVVNRIRANYRLSHLEAARLAAVTNCECCGVDITGPRRRHIDHDYETGFVRGVLCPSCNTGIGKLGDTIASLERALTYLRRSVRVQPRTSA